jgi:PAS domain S-box-containing protein
LRPELLRPDDLLDAIPCGVVSFDDTGAMVYVNAGFAALIGYAPDELLGRHVETTMTVAGRIFFQTHLYPLVRLHGRAEEMFVLLRAKDGTDVGVLLNAARRVTDDGARVDVAVMEVRERRKFEDALVRAKQAAEASNAALIARTEELEAANQQLEEQAVELERLRTAADEANNAKSQFLAVMSHELRTPLNAIGGYVQLIELGIHGAVTHAQRDALDRITRAQRHLLRLINDVLNLARIEAGRVEYVRELVPLDQVVQSAIPMVETQMAAANLTSRIDIAPGLAAMADREKVQQILINLLTNAVKFTPAGGSVTMEARADGARILLRVIDSGIGIPADKLGGVFAPFVQVDTTHTRAREGSGLGLAISRDLARGMGGDLTAESAEGRGSTFTLSLPSA